VPPANYELPCVVLTLCYSLRATSAVAMGKRKKPKQKPNTPPPPPSPSKPTHEKWKWDWKYWLALAIGIIGLILGAITLQARPTVSLEAPLDPRNVLSTPFVISNDGMLALENVEVASFLIRVADINGNLQMGNIGGGYVPPSALLEAGERETVPFKHFLSSDAPIIEADVALVVTFSPQFLAIIKETRVFRFVAVRQANGLLRLVQEPANDALQQYRKIMKEFGK
jgi:hypothetical protein